MSTSCASGENDCANASGKSSAYVAWMRSERCHVVSRPVRAPLRGKVDGEAVEFEAEGEPDRARCALAPRLVEVVVPDAVWLDDVGVAVDDPEVTFHGIRLCGHRRS